MVSVGAFRLLVAVVASTSLAWKLVFAEIHYSIHRFTNREFHSWAKLAGIVKLHRLDAGAGVRLHQHNSLTDYFVLVPDKPPTLSFMIGINCQDSEKNCKQKVEFSPELHLIHEDIKKTCRSHNLAENDCMTLEQSARRKQHAFLNSKEVSPASIVPVSFCVQIFLVAKALAQRLECNDRFSIEDDWSNTTCLLAKKLVLVGEKEPWHTYIELQRGSKTAWREMDVVYAVSSALPWDVIHDLGIAALMAAGHDRYPPTQRSADLSALSVALLESILHVEPRCLGAARASALIRRYRHEYNAASSHYIRAARLLRPLLGTVDRSVGIRNQQLDYRVQYNSTPSKRAVIFKLRNDAEQMEYLLRLGILDSAQWTPIASEYRALVAEWEGLDKKETYLIGKVIPLNYTLVSKTYGRIYYVRQTPALWPRSIALGHWRGRDIAEAYANHAPGMVVIDDFLSPIALNELFQFATQSSVFHRVMGGSIDRAYLGSYLDEGFAPGLLFQIVAELQARLPELIGKYKLVQAWAYKYMGDEESLEQGISVHADAAAVNINFWITPDSANLLPQDGGLDIFDKEAPDEWNFATANTKPDKIMEFLETEPRAKKSSVAYRQNRCVMFHSNLFHQTGKVQFKKGFLNRRINLTLLFGLRQQRRRKH